MTDGSRTDLPKDAGIALSGGGFRATLFHLGALWRMNEFGLLGSLDRITSVSGGSILAGLLGFRWNELKFENGVAANYREKVAEPIQDFCGQTIDTWAIAKGKLNPFKRVADYVAEAYDDKLFGGATLRALPDDSKKEGPRFIIYATNLQSGVSFRFSRPYMADYRIGLNRNTDGVLIADAVAASSAFPPVLSPMVLETNPDDWEQDPDKSKRGDLWANTEFRRKIYLTDGGVYDNMGLEAVFDRCDPLYISAAGAPFSEQPLGWLETNTEVGIGLRTTGILTEQCRALRRRMAVDRFTQDGIKGAYWNISSEIARYDLADPILSDNATTRRQRFVRTRLNSFDPQEQGHLINWGYVMADTAIRRWVNLPDTPAWSWPIEEYPLEDKAG
ncbi:MAG: patatin-like phospholipase family protein [Pseudomonadota bacterium]